MIIIKNRSLLLALIIIVFTFIGCAHTQTTPYVIPEHILVRLNKIAEEVSICIQPRTDLEYYITNDREPNAWVTENGIYLTEGLFGFNDDALKFIVSHEIAHNKLGHLANLQTIGYVTTGVMMAVDVLLPGAGLLNYFVNPAVISNFSKPQEFEADTEAAKACLCLGMSIADVVMVLEKLRSAIPDGGGFWDQHPSWDERIENIQK